MNITSYSKKPRGDASKDRFRELKKTEQMIKASTSIVRDTALEFPPATDLHARLNGLFIELRRPLNGKPVRRDSILRILIPRHERELSDL